MTKLSMTPVMRVQLKLALAASSHDRVTLRSVETEAMQLRLSGAEIDAAKRGASFNALIDVAVKFALAVYFNDTVGVAATKKRLLSFQLAAIVPEIHVLVRETPRPALP
ncbi:hypothetical protein [Pararhizobium sp. DWP1-1-3]|uniref:hypothetical protein n=1 Tax=Pararhizobium sp. DWP1-1-3 TaxID=2804652 RepID=UPI003CEB96DC